MNTSAQLFYHSKSSDEELLTVIYVLVDTILTHFREKRLTGERIPGRKPALTESELVTLAIFRFHLGFSDLKHTYRFYYQYLKKLFPDLPRYQNFVCGINLVSGLAGQILKILMKIPGQDNSNLKIIDSLPLPTCDQRRSSTNKVTKGLATISRSSRGWYYGLKLHGVVDELGNLLNVRITTATVDDRFPVKNLIKNLSGKFVADAGYLSEELTRTLKDMGKGFLTGVRKNMKKILTEEDHQTLKKRQYIESVFSVLTERLKIRTSLPRSIQGMLSHYIYALLSYQIFKFLRVIS
jgi:hypothetical protein